MSIAELAPLITAKGLEKRCKLPQRGLGRSPSGSRILCILGLKSEVCWHQFTAFSEDQLTTVCQEYV